MSRYGIETREHPGESWLPVLRNNPPDEFQELTVYDYKVAEDIARRQAVAGYEARVIELAGDSD